MCIAAALLACGALIAPSWAADATYSQVSADQHLKEWLVLGPIPTYVTLRYLGVPLARMWHGVGLACAAFGALVTGICTVAGL